MVSMSLLPICTLQVAQERIQKDETDFHIMFQDVLAMMLSSNTSTYNKAGIKNVFKMFVRKVINTRIQEFLSAMKQKLATKKGLTSTVDINLQITLLAHHTKLETKLKAESS